VTIRKLNAHSLAIDIRSGLDDTTLMDKYGLSASQLEIAVGKLVHANLIAESDVSHRGQHRPVETKGSSPVPANPQVHNRNYTEELSAKCPHCGMARSKGETECSHCGIVFSKVEHSGNVTHLTHIAPGQLDPDLQTGTYHNLIAEAFYEEAAEAHEKKRKKKLRILWTAVTIGVMPIPFALLGLGREIMLTYTLAAALFVFLYYIVVVYYAAQQSRLFGLLCIAFSPVAILFVIINWNGIFSGKFLPKLWLALMIPLTVAVYLAKYGHYKIFPCG